ncbi:MAG: CopG family transcriptional regulator [Acutalibacteraceae bacterium]|nr:CopG family transcriptional regulator [Acutalibacteraceae bacterium]
MGKTLYSLMLNENVVREIDILAHKSGTSRSNLVNQILAEYVNYTTPERRINDVLSAIEQLMMPSREIVPFFAPNSQSMSLKSSLEYKYRPTVKYDVELYRGDSDAIGKLSVLFRTQSQPLIENMTAFFRLWKKIEDAHLAPMIQTTVDYALYDGKFERSISVPNRDCTTSELAQTISDYIKLFDKQMKNYLCGNADPRSVEGAYYDYLKNARILI